MPLRLSGHITTAEAAAQACLVYYTDLLHHIDLDPMFLL